MTERLPKPELIQDLHHSHPDLKWNHPIQAVDGGVLAVHEDSDKKYNVIKIDQEGEITNKLYVTDKPITGLIWEDPDLYVLLEGGDIVHMREGGVIKQHHINSVRGNLLGGAIDSDNVLMVDEGHFSNDGRVISFNVQEEHEEIKLNGLQIPTSMTKTVYMYNNQVLYLITEYWGRCVSVYDFSWIKQTTIERFVYIYIYIYIYMKKA